MTFIETVLTNPLVIAGAVTSLTELAKRLNVSKTYLPYIATGIGAVIGYILSLNIETLATVEGILTTGILGAITTGVYAVMDSKK
jgi:hypothetical protein